LAKIQQKYYLNFSAIRMDAKFMLPHVNFYGV